MDAQSAEERQPAEQPVFDTQRNAPPLSSPQEALDAIRVPEGFHVQLFAAEPEVRQPIAMTTDARGRLWIAENYTYAERPIVVDTRHHDRIVILEDRDSDGTSDSRTVFWDEGRQLTSIEVGFGGVWAMCPPELLFIPDRDQDDHPDSEPIVMLDGFDVGDANHHNFANGLKWGPDGWLYGRNGISNVGHVAKPGTPPEFRAEVPPGIWRFHPVTRSLEVVCTGTTNPWGHDWDDYGELFFINTVIGHLWHGVPGAHFKRMFGANSNPYVYELIDQTADHVHWDTAEAWNEAKQGLSQTTDAAGGGHAHVGMMIYLADNWPAEYRGKLFTLNMHGRRINCDRLERHGASYVGRHDADLLFSDDQWFRGTELLYGPDGSVIVADWSDVGECHENDGVHRSSGRLYRVSYGESATRPPEDLSALSSQELVALQLAQNDWYVRQARRLLHERATRGKDMADVHQALRALFADQSDATRKLRALWALYVTGGTTRAWLLDQLDAQNEHVRVWAIRLLLDQSPATPDVLRAFAHRAQTDSSGLVLLYLTSALQRIPGAERWELARALAIREDVSEDRVLPLLLWYGIESAVPEFPEQAAQLAIATRMGRVREFIARRLTQELERNPSAAATLVKHVQSLEDPSRRSEILGGMNDALRGWRSAEAPDGWGALQERWQRSSSDEVRRLLREVASVFGDGRALDELKQIVVSNDHDIASRRAAIRSLVSARAEGLQPVLRKLLTDRDLGADAVRGLAAAGDAVTHRELLDHYLQLSPPARVEVIAALAARPESALALLQAVQSGRIDREQVAVFQIRQMQTYDNAELQQCIKELWPELRPIAADKQARIAELRAQLDGTLGQANRSHGRAVWEKTCAKCHLLFGQGGKIGPDLTGAQRANLDYVLENVVDPSATLAANFRMTTIVLVDGRVVNGLVLTRTEQTWEVQTPTDKIVLAVAEIDEARESNVSLMPEGQLDVLKPDEIRDLIAYVMSPAQVPLPE